MHRLIIHIALALPFLMLPATAQDAGAPELEVLDSSEVDLAQFQWVARPLVVFADASADPRFVEQLGLLADQAGALADRDVVVIADTDPANLSAVRSELRPRGFMLALLAKDGSVVFRKPFPWDVREISRAIDKLPMRKQELASERAVN